MCLTPMKNQYLCIVMEIQQIEFETNPYPCNLTLPAAAASSSQLDVFNVTAKNNSLTPIITPPGYTDSTLVVIIVYCVMFVIAAAGNLSVVITLFRSRRHRKSRVSLMICHLAVADLMVAFIMIPLEVGWRITVEWHAGNIACKVFLFMRAFCLYLSSNVLVCVSLDRCFAVVYPLRVSDARKRGKMMLAGAWIIALLNAIPQSIIFRVQQHPDVPGFWQCVTFGFFSTTGMETAYNLFCVIAMYFLPLMIISAAYSVIVCEISNRSSRSRTRDDGNDTTASGALRLRCSALTHIERARQRTFRLTVTIVVVFIWCWTPYVVMTLWYMFDRESAVKVDNTVQDGLFLMAVSNSCMNPLIYGSYAMKCKFPWNRKRPNDVVMGGTPGLQRRSTVFPDGVNAAQSDRVIKRDNEQNMKIENGFKNYGSGTYGRVSAVTKLLTEHRNNNNNIKQSFPPVYRHRLSYQTASRGQIYTIVKEHQKINNRASFHSEPSAKATPVISGSLSNNEIKNTLARSLDIDEWH